MFIKKPDINFYLPHSGLKPRHAKNEDTPDFRLEITKRFRNHHGAEVYDQIFTKPDVKELSPEKSIVMRELTSLHFMRNKTSLGEYPKESNGLPMLSDSLEIAQPHAFKLGSKSSRFRGDPVFINGPVRA